MLIPHVVSFIMTVSLNSAVDSGNKQKGECQFLFWGRGVFVNPTLKKLIA